MELRFTYSGSTIASVVADCVPSVGSLFRIRTEHYKKGLTPGSIIQAEVSEDFPPVYDFIEGVVYIDVDQFEIISEGPPVES